MLSLRTIVVAAGLLLVPGAAQAQRTCKTGGLFAGNPTFKPTGNEKIPPAGVGLTDEPQVQWRTLDFAGDNLYTNNGQEIWVADLKTEKMRRVAGQENPGAARFSDGPCGSKARFVNIHGLAVLKDGSLIVADHGAHAILRVTDPLDAAKCNVSFLAGTRKATDSTNYLRPGDKDGPGAQALLGQPEWPVVDGAGNVYFVDGASGKLKHLGLDDEVTTIAKLPRDKIQTFRGMTLLGDKLYTIGNSLATGFVHEIDPQRGKVRQVLAATYEQMPEVGGNQAVALSSITNDGKDLFVSSSGFIWRLNPRGGKPVHIAGAGSPQEYPKSYNPEGSYAAKQLILRYRVGDQGAMGTNTAMAYHDGALYWRGRSDSSFVLKIDCR
jgi:hypothetical protein